MSVGPYCSGPVASGWKQVRPPPADAVAPDRSPDLAAPPPPPAAAPGAAVATTKRVAAAAPSPDRIGPSSRRRRRGPRFPQATALGLPGPEAPRGLAGHVIEDLPPGDGFTGEGEQGAARGVDGGRREVEQVPPARTQDAHVADGTLEVDGSAVDVVQRERGGGRGGVGGDTRHVCPRGAAGAGVGHPVGGAEEPDRQLARPGPAKG